MKKNSWKLVLVKDTGDVIIDSFKTEESAKAELQYRESLCIAMGYSVEFPYRIREIIT